MKKNWRQVLTPIVDKLQPVARVAERVAILAVQVKNPTFASVTGMVGAGIAELASQLGNNKAPGWSIEPYLSRGQTMQALEEAGAKVVVRRYHDNSETIECDLHGARFYLNAVGEITTMNAISDDFIEWLRQTYDRVLPPAIEVRRRRHLRESLSYEARPIALSTYANAQAAKILASTMPLLDGGRAILLDGKPGVGKTTLAQIIARDANLGRVVTLDGQIVGSSTSTSDGAESAPRSGSGVMRESLRLLSAGVIIVDDIDKLYLRLESIEAMRAAARLVIFTANNGQYDEVLDGAQVRPGRVDEVFSIEPVEMARMPPFDLLSDEDWAEVSQWPIASLVEVRKRLQHRPSEIRIEDLRARLVKKTRSGDVLR